MIALSEISQPQRDKDCRVFPLLGTWEEKNVKVKGEHSTGKERKKEREHITKWGHDQNTLYDYVGMSYYIVSDNE